MSVFKGGRAERQVRVAREATWSGGAHATAQSALGGVRANLCAKIVDFGGSDSHAHREFSGKFESSNLSRDSLSREIGRWRVTKG